ncbi:MAG: type II toxin-antitoxin system VapC family toxin [Acetobacteraceae bacterium]|nr:type II toxin-antitoxin system VapC family toxin [Acetobacteraceae bacterium]
MGRRARSGSVRPDYPAQVLQALRRLRLHLTPNAELLDHATELSASLRHPLYDCLYLALYRRFSAHLATFDKGLGSIARRDGLLLELQ